MSWQWVINSAWDWYFYADEASTTATYTVTQLRQAKMEVGQWVMGHSQWPIDPWWNNSIPLPGYLLLSSMTGHYLAYFVLSWHCETAHSLNYAYYHTWRLNFNLRFLWSHSQNPKGLSSTTMPRPLLLPCVGWNDVMTTGHGSRYITHSHLWHQISLCVSQWTVENCCSQHHIQTPFLSPNEQDKSN